MKAINDYHDLYLKCDTSLLADVFERIRNGSLKNYELCPSHYLSTPVLRWDAILNLTKVELELISRAAMHFFFFFFGKI